MEQKIVEMSKTSAKGSVQLFIGISTSTLIMALGTIILARLMTPEEYGLYSIALIPSYTFILFRDWGINSALTKYTASLRAEGREEETRNIISAGLTFETITGTALTLISIALSTLIATTVFHRPETASLIAIASATILSGAISTATQSAFVGFERMELNTLTMITQAATKTIISPLLVLIGYSALGATLGYTVSTITAAIIGVTALYIGILKRLRKGNPQKRSLKEDIKKMLNYGIPASISSIIAGLLIQFYAFLMAIYCTDEMIGNYTVATQFAVILTFFTNPIYTVLFPAFSKINPKKEKELLQTVFTASIKYTSLILIPATMAVMVLSKPMIATLFGEKWTHAPTFLTLYVINNLFAVIGSLSLGTLLLGLGETKTLMKLSLINLAFGVPLALTLIPTLGIIGLIATLILAGKPSTAIGLYWIWKRYRTKPDLNSSTRILLSSTISATLTYLTTTLTGTPEWIKLIIGATTFLALYLTITPLIRAVNKTDIKNLKTMLSDLGIISKLIDIPLTITEKIAKP